jgi:ATP-dependent RNA helicase DeaD
LNNFKEFNLDPQILRGVNKAGFIKPTPVQERAIFPLLSGKDVIGQAKTGTGKTAAFGLPMLQSIKTSDRSVQAIVLSPTRELALQITNELRKLGKYLSARILTIYGGQRIDIQFESLDRGAHIIVGTPGRMIDHIKRGTLDLNSVRTVVVDEADTMLDMGFIGDVEFILDSIDENRQLSLFSATMPRQIIDLSKKYMKNPQKILIDSDEPSVNMLDQYYIALENQSKLLFLTDFLKKNKPESCIIFCRTKRGVQKLVWQMENKFFNAVPLHGDLSQNQRERSMHHFRKGNADILVATDVASRGIDIPQVDYVINYEVPRDPLLYFHRVGRTARAGETGKAFTFISKEDSYEFNRICQMTRATIKPLRIEDEKIVSKIPTKRYNTASKQVRTTRRPNRFNNFREKRRYR